MDIGTTKPNFHFAVIMAHHTQYDSLMNRQPIIHWPMDTDQDSALGQLRQPVYKDHFKEHIFLYSKSTHLLKKCRLKTMFPDGRLRAL